MKKRFFAFLLTAVLLLSLLPFVFVSSADDPVDEGIVQGADDTVIIMLDGAFGSTSTNFQAATQKAGTTGRTIFVLAYNYQIAQSSTRTFIAGSGWQNAELAFTSKVKITTPAKTYTLSAFDGTPALVDPAEYPAGTVINHFDNSDESKNVTLTSPATAACWLDCFSKTEFDYLNFKCAQANYFFYANYFDVTFGEHFNTIPYVAAGKTEPSASGYPALVNGLDAQARDARAASGWSDHEAVGTTFTKTQTIKVLGGTWNYITPSYRANQVTNSGTINLFLKNVTTLCYIARSTTTPRTTIMMGRDIYTAEARVNVTVEACNFKQFAFFSAKNDAGSAVNTNAGKLSVTLNGHNYFNRGLEYINGTADTGFTDVFQDGASLTLTVNGTVEFGSLHTIYGIDNTKLTSTVNYDKTQNPFGSVDPDDCLDHFDVINDEFVPFVQGENDAVVFLGILAPADLNTVFNSFADNKVKTSDETEYGPYDRIIVCLTETYTFPSGNASNDLFDSYNDGAAYYSNRAGSFLGNELAATACREQIVFTSYVRVTDPDKVFSVSGTTVTKDTAKTAMTYDYYTNGAALAQLPTTRYVALCSDVTFDYIRFHVMAGTPLFYMQYNDVYFGKHYQITSAVTCYPILMQGQQYGITKDSYDNPPADPADAVYKFTEWSPQESSYSPLQSGETQTVTVLGGTWNYISLRNRITQTVGVTYLYGVIDLTLVNVTVKSTSSLMAGDVYTAGSRVNATIKDCTFEGDFGFFEEPSKAHADREMSGTLSVTLEGTNTFNNGILGVVAHSYRANLSNAHLSVTNNGTLALGADKTVSGACEYAGYSSSGGAYSQFANTGTITVGGSAVTEETFATKVIGFNTYPTNAHGAIVYWNTSAETDSWGCDAEHPTRLLENALDYLQRSLDGYGTVMMVGNCWVNVSGNYLTFPDFGDHELYVEAAEDNGYLLVLVDPYVCLNGPTIFKNINFAKTSSRSIFAYDYDLTFDNCGYYKNDGGYSTTNLPEKGDPVKNIDDPTSTIFISTRGLSTDSISLANGKTIRQTIKITGNTDGFAVRRICAARKSGISSLYAPDTDASTGCDGQVNIVVGDNASVDYIDTIANEANTYKVNVTLPRALIENGKVQIKTANAAPSDGITTAVYVRGDSGDSVLQQNAPTFSKQGENGYSLRGLKDGKYAMRAGFKVPVSELENAVEYGVLVKRTNNTRPFAWFEGSGVNANKIGKSIVYLPALPEEEGIDNRWIVTESDVEYSSFTAPLTFAAATLNSTKAGNKYDFDPYVVYAYTFGGTTVKTVFRGSESGVSITNVSLQDMIDVCAAAIDKPVANALAAEIADVITDNG